MSEIFNPVTGSRSSFEREGGSNIGASVNKAERRLGKELYQEQKRAIIFISLLVLFFLLIIVFMVHYLAFSTYNRDELTITEPLTLDELRENDSSLLDFLCRGRRCR